MEALLAFLPLGEVGQVGSRLQEEPPPPPTQLWPVLYVTPGASAIVTTLIVRATTTLLSRQETEWGPAAPNPRVIQQA